MAIQRVNHHHLSHMLSKVDGPILLFWISPMPFVTGYMGENHAIPLSLALYRGVATALMCFMPDRSAEGK